MNAGSDAQPILQVNPTKLVAAPDWVGRRFAGELHASSAGKLALAELSDDDIRSLLPPSLPAYTAKTITTIDGLLAALDRVRGNGYAETVQIEETCFPLANKARVR